MLGTASATLILTPDEKPLKVALLGVEPGHVGEPSRCRDTQLGADTADEVIIDRATLPFAPTSKSGDTAYPPSHPGHRG